MQPKLVSGAAMTTDSETRTHTLTHTRKRAAKINELVEQRQGIATHTRIHTHTHIYTHAHKRTAGINEIAEPDASAAVYPALLILSNVQVQCVGISNEYVQCLSKGLHQKDHKTVMQLMIQISTGKEPLWFETVLDRCIHFKDLIMNLFPMSSRANE